MYVSVLFVHLICCCINKYLVIIVSVYRTIKAVPHAAALRRISNLFVNTQTSLPTKFDSSMLTLIIHLDIPDIIDDLNIVIDDLNIIIDDLYILINDLNFIMDVLNIVIDDLNILIYHVNIIMDDLNICKY